MTNTPKSDEPSLNEHDATSPKKRRKKRKGVALLPPGAQTRVYITRMDLEGRGCGQVPLDGQKVDVAVRGAFVGDTVRMVVERIFAKRRLMIGRVVKVLKRGDMRTEKECAHPSPCLGCPLDGMLYNATLDLKRQRITTALAKYDLDVEVDAFVLPESTTGRRQKIKLMIGGRPDRPLFGLYRPYSQYIVDTTLCVRHHPELNRVLALLREAITEPALFDDEESSRDDPRQVPGQAIIARVFESGVSVIFVVEDALPDEKWKALCELVDEGTLASIAEQKKSAGNNIVAGDLLRSHGELWLTPLGQSDAKETALHFCQPDAELADELYEEAAAWVTQECKNVADLYAGSGGFSRHLLQCGATRVVAVESDERARQSLENTGAECIIAPAAEALKQDALKGIEGIIADPPRRGLYDDAEAIAALGAKRLVLVSCDPNSMARDLRVLVDAGYAIRRLTPYDLFVGSVAVECMTLLEKV